MHPAAAWRSGFAFCAACRDRAGRSCSGLRPPRPLSSVQVPLLPDKVVAEAAALAPAALLAPAIVASPPRDPAAPAAGPPLRATPRARARGRRPEAGRRGQRNPPPPPAIISAAWRRISTATRIIRMKRASGTNRAWCGCTSSWIAGHVLSYDIAGSSGFAPGRRGART